MEGISEDASRNTLALNPLVGIRGQDLVDSAGILFKAVVNEPKVATEQWLSFLGELGSIVAGKSERAPKAGDRRFSDAAWKESALHSGMLKAYLAWGDAVSGFVDKTSLSDIDKARAHLVTEILIDAVAPTNAMLTNPAAVRKFVDTGGRSLWHGLKNYFDDLAKNGGMPSMVDQSAFKVGENSGDHAGRGGLPQRIAGADPVYADDAECEKAAAGHHPAADQQILRAGSVARQKHGPLPARQRHSGVLRQLAQSDRGASRMGARYLCRGA